MISSKFSNPAYRIETKRLVVRCYDPSDAPLLAESVSENVEHLRPWMPWVYSEPEPMEAEPLDVPRQLRGAPQCVSRRAADGDGREVED